MSKPSKAKRGDLVVIEFSDRYWSYSEGAREASRFVIGVVTSITRDGKVKHYREATNSEPHKWINLADFRRWPVGYVRHYIVPQGEIDVAACLTTAAANPWPSGMPGKYFDSLEEVKTILRRHLIRRTATA